MLNWCKAFGLALVCAAAIAGVVAVFIAVAEHYGSYAILGLVALILLGSVTWAIHDVTKT